MKIIAISVVKNESDIIEYSLKRAEEWADKVIVYDNGSTDGTWDIVKSLSNSRIIPFRQDNRPYSDGLRALIFNSFKSEMQNGDWWVIQDADETYFNNPREFINSQEGYFHHINGKKIDFCFDINRIESIDLSGDFSKDVQLFNFYTPVAWSEPRAIKHREKLTWKEERIWPNHMGIVCENTINIKHYPLRSPEQIKNRWKTRAEVKARGGQSFEHWEKGEWKEYYSNKAKNIEKVIDEDLLFKQVMFANNYKQSFVKRLVKTVLHALGVWN